MNNKRLLIGLALVAAVFAAIFIYSGSKDSNSDTVTVDLYFLNENMTSITPESREIKAGSEGRQIKEVVEELISGPADNKNKPIISSETEILDIDRNGSHVLVDFSGEYLSEDNNHNLLSTYAVVKSLCGLQFVDMVKVTANGEEIIAADGSIIDFLSASDINLETEQSIVDSKRAVLYFADKESSRLVREARRITVNDTQPIEQYIVNALIAGPEKKGLSAVVSADTSLISAETKDMICFVNFKSNFVDKNTGNAAKERLALYSIVNSLTELDTVDAVQILVDGKKIDKFGSFDVSDNLTRDESLIM